MKFVFKYSNAKANRLSSPKILPAAPALISAFTEGHPTSEDLGRIFESIVGHRLCEAFQEVYYWREGHFEIDFVILMEKTVVGIEVKSKARKSISLTKFREKFPQAKTIFIDQENYIEFEKSPKDFIKKFSV